MEEIERDQRITVLRRPFRPADVTGRDDLLAALPRNSAPNRVRNRCETTGRARGFAFVEMATDEEAKEAISRLDGYSLKGRNLRVDEARPREPGRFSGGGSGGGGGRKPRW